MKIVLYSTSVPPAVGGAERFVGTLADALVAAGNDVTLVTPAPDAPHDGSYEQIAGAGPADVLRASRAADVVHVSGLSIRGISPARASGRPCVVTHHGYQAVCPTGLAWSPEGRCTANAKAGPCDGCPRSGHWAKAAVWAHRFAARRAAVNVFVSEWLATRIGLPGPVIPDPVAPPEVEPTQRDEGLIAAAGRFVMEKGFATLIDAMCLMPDARLELAGDGPLSDKLRDQARRAGVADRVRFSGALHQREVSALFARAAVVCVPSAWDEPFGYTATEAMAVGTPVVATPSGALVECLSDGRGFLASDSTASALAEALRGALGDPRCGESVALTAREYVSELAPDRVAAHYLDVYRSTA